MNVKFTTQHDSSKLTKFEIFFISYNLAAVCINIEKPSKIMKNPQRRDRKPGRYSYIDVVKYMFFFYTSADNKQRLK